jgi:hypothetical protein
MPHNDVSKPFKGFCVARDDLRRWHWEERSAADTSNLRQGEIIVEIDKFAFTASNVTYARLGDQIAYWRFFPAAEGWGYIPVWSLGNVIRSLQPEINEGERVYGYFPMATHLLMRPSGQRGARMVDATEHRQELPKTYNECVLINRDAGYDRVHEDEHLVLRPLFSLSFFCAEYLKEERFFDGKQVLISSASSKDGARARLSAGARAPQRCQDRWSDVPGERGFRRAARRLRRRSNLRETLLALRCTFCVYRCRRGRQGAGGGSPGTGGFVKAQRTRGLYPLGRAGFA